MRYDRAIDPYQYRINDKPNGFSLMARLDLHQG